MATKKAAKKKNTTAQAKTKAAKKAPAKKKTVAKKKAAKKAAAPAKAVKKAVKSTTKAAKPAPKAKRAKTTKPAEKRTAASGEAPEELSITPKKVVKVTPFMKMQRQRLLDLRDSLVDAMAGVARDNLRSRAEGSEASAYGMHQADAGSDAYDRDFALNLLSQEQDALYEIEEALKRLDLGTYGICEMSGKEIMKERLEALPFARFTVECQEKVERETLNGNYRRPMRSLFGTGTGDSEDGGEDSFDDDKE